MSKFLFERQLFGVLFRVVLLGYLVYLLILQGQHMQLGSRGDRRWVPFLPRTLGDPQEGAGAEEARPLGTPLSREGVPLGKHRALCSVDAAEGAITVGTGLPGPGAVTCLRDTGSQATSEPTNYRTRTLDHFLTSSCFRIMGKRLSDQSTGPERRQMSVECARGGLSSLG